VSEWLAAAFEVEITPPLDVPLGSGFNPPQVQGVADSLFTRALVLSDGATKVAMTSSDILAIDPMLSTDVRRLVAAQTDIPPDHVMVSATHTHSCGGRLQPSRGDGDTALLEILARQIAGAVAAANRALRPARLSIGAASVEGVTKNRRDPDAPVDRALRVLRVDGAHGLAAAVAAFACHPILVMRDRPVLSGDYPGMMAATVKRASGVPVVVLPVNGPCGDVNPMVLSSDGVEAARWIADRLSGEALALLARLKGAGRVANTENTRWGLTLEVEAAPGTLRLVPPLLARTATVRVPYKSFSPSNDLAAAAAQAAERLVAAGLDPATIGRWQEGRSVAADTEHGMTETARRNRRSLAAELLQRRSEAWSARVAEHQGIVGRPYRELELQAFALGAGAAVLAVPFELFSHVGLAIQASNPFPHLMIVTYSNDLGGYLMPDEEYGRGGFEPGITFYGPGAAAAVRDGCLGLLRDLAARARA
jgi:hypothetical protein